VEERPARGSGRKEKEERERKFEGIKTILRRGGNVGLLSKDQVRGDQNFWMLWA